MSPWGILKGDGVKEGGKNEEVIKGGGLLPSRPANRRSVLAFPGQGVMQLSSREELFRGGHCWWGPDDPLIFHQSSVINMQNIAWRPLLSPRQLLSTGNMDNLSGDISAHLH